jgi:Fe-S cluster assembly protein SufD
LVSYDSFVREAAEGYARLPEERSELYKRHHIPISGIPNMDIKPNEDSDSLKGFLETNKDLGMKFDLIMGSTSHIINNSAIKVKGPEEAEEEITHLMHKNGEDKYSSFINAHSRRYVMIDVPKGKNEELGILFLNSGSPLLSHILISAGDNTNTRIVELFASEGRGSAVGTIHEIRMGDYSNLELDAIHNENSNTRLLSFCKNRTGSDTKLKFSTFYNGSAQTRVRNVMCANGQGSEISINEIVMGSSSQKFDIATEILNLGRESNASLDTKAAVADTSRCIMKGFARVLKGASKSRSYIHERGIILDKGARIDGLPDMSVDENEVKATHSSATSPIDPETVFYLMSRGIGGSGVRKLIVSGFLGDSLSKMHSSKARELAMSLVDHKLETKEFGSMPRPDGTNAWIFGGETQKDMFMGHYKYR